MSHTFMTQQAKALKVKIEKLFIRRVFICKIVYKDTNQIYQYLCKIFSQSPKHIVDSGIPNRLPSNFDPFPLEAFPRKCFSTVCLLVYIEWFLVKQLSFTCKVYLVSLFMLLTLLYINNWLSHCQYFATLCM